MKLTAFYATAVALSLAIPLPATAKDNDINRDLVGLLSMQLGVATKCDNYEIVQGGALKFADQNGADFDTVGPAVLNAVLSITDQEYDREKLVPAITQAVRSDFSELADDFERLGKNKFCNKYGRVLVYNGFLDKKK